MLYVNCISPSNYLLSVAEFRYTLNRNDRSVCRCGCAHANVSFGWVHWRWRSRNCLLTPPQYVRTISHAALFKGKRGSHRQEGRKRGQEERRGGRERHSGILQQRISTMCLSYKPLQNLTNYSTLYPPSLPLSFFLHFPCASSSLPSTVLYLFLHHIPISSLPSLPASLSPARANNLPEEIWLAQRRAENHSLLEKWHTHRQYSPAAQRWERKRWGREERWERETGCDYNTTRAAQRHSG